ncbi:glycosyltransferase [Paenibacillus donghaensis]|uniref:CgeB family protein n=1 Tax=Paenibacillus donghaensis TaxID=414771 RepID=UPI001883EE66|nr:glycosyltransferase [Paenibacillus donghaensis]MBE9915163.1 glycosyltransferase [Paenibacillus donghaensis]
MRILFLESHPLLIHGLPNGFRDAGHTVKISGPLTSNNIPRLISSFRPDLIITLGCGPEHFLEKQEWIRDYVPPSGIPHVYWATEDPTHTYTFTIPYIQRVKPNFVFTICRDRVKDYMELGFPAAHMDFGFHSSVHHRVRPIPKYRNSIAVVANAYPHILKTYPKHYRITSLKTLIRPLIKRKIRIDFYGNSWRRMEPFLGKKIPRSWAHGYLSYPQANKVYSSSDIIIGLQNQETQVTQRTYEILGSGGFLLTSDTHAVRELFTPGKDLVVSSSPKETLRLINYYLNHPEERRKIQKSGQRTVRKHSYKYRARYMIRVLRKNGILENRSKGDSL